MVSAIAANNIICGAGKSSFIASAAINIAKNKPIAQNIEVNATLISR